MGINASFERVRVVLVETSLARNIGSVARAMRTMGFRRLVLVNPLHFPHADATATASGADDVLEQASVVDSLEQALVGTSLAIATSARLRELKVPEVTPRQAAMHTLERMQEAEVALVFGSERVGLTNAQLIHCHQLCCIPTAPDFSSLNLAQAVQLLLYEVRVGALSATAHNEQHGDQASNASTRRRDDRPATIDELEGFLQHHRQLLERVDFLAGRSPVKVLRRIARIYQRAELSLREVQILRGICTETLRKLGREAQLPSDR
jgi:tRNA (cytidine32/uridine32-2'-O)-methyltransferase